MRSDDPPLSEKTQRLYIDSGRQSELEALNHFIATDRFGVTSDNPNDGITKHDQRRTDTVEGVSILTSFFSQLERIPQEPNYPFADPSNPSEPTRPLGLGRDTSFEREFGTSYLQLLDRIRMRHLGSPEEQLMPPSSPIHPGAVNIPIEDVIELRQLVQNRQTECFDRAKTSGGGFSEGDAYAWQLRTAGFDLGLRYLGFDLSDGKIVPGVKIRGDQIITHMNGLPTRNQFTAILKPTP